MADDKDKKAPPEAPAEDTPNKEPAPEKDVGELTKGKYKTADDLAKAYQELETKLGEQSEKIRQAEEFTQVVQPLLDEIRSDPELFKQLDERLRKKVSPDTTPDSQTKGDDKTADQNEMRTVASDLILARFEERHGIDKLSADKRKDIRRNIGDVIFRITGKSLSGVDLRRLGPVLEDAYILANKDKLLEKSKLEALVSAKEDDDASIPGLPSSPGKGEGTLTSEEADIAGKLGLAREQYLEGKKGLVKR